MKSILITSICAAALSLSACNGSGSIFESSASAQPGLATQAALDSYVKKWVQENDFNGVIAVRRAGQNDFRYAKGIADLRRQTWLTEQSVFQTGSIDKLFASAAIFAMADEGVIDLDAPITTYLPEYRADTGGQITVADLLTNRSGLPEGFRALIGSLPKRLQINSKATDEELGIDMTLGQAVSAYAQGDLDFTPGSAFDYNITNWVVIHHIIETVSGQSYANVLNKYVFRPAGMTRSGVFTMDLDGKDVGDFDVAVGYDNDDENHTGDYPLPVMIGGGTYTNGADMLDFFEALYDGKIIGADGLTRFNTITTPDENYAYGGRVTAYDGAPEKLYSWQSGSNGATNVVAIYAMDGSYSFVAMSNRAQEQDALFALSRHVETLPQ
ncbi:serine hydrolase domain-containing protein [Robiginitomaculum antarcticum]|uniref:serine hydrolase domain-containing protein n=1 Tax=Robiginitomaculum antarcticum TaxID=437507 RepID=UPI000375EE14|nr:serine hydrolase domain-containing protein [Robiginitomaculum antarcticum]